jgi:chorismate synthase
MLRFTTQANRTARLLVSVLEGMPAGLPLLASHIDGDLARRSRATGRGRRMQIERDTAEILSGVRAGETLGGPIAMLIRNRDWANWQAIMDPAPREGDAEGSLRRRRSRACVRATPISPASSSTIARTARDILERASARETTARVAAGAIARRLLEELGVSIGSHLVHLGGVGCRASRSDAREGSTTASDASQLRTLDPNAEAQMIERIEAAKRAGNTLGGICEVVVDGLPVGWARTCRGTGSSTGASAPPSSPSRR